MRRPGFQGLAVGELCRQWQSPARARVWGLVAADGAEALWAGELQEQGWPLQVWWLPRPFVMLNWVREVQREGKKGPGADLIPGGICLQGCKSALESEQEERDLTCFSLWCMNWLSSACWVRRVLLVRPLRLLHGELEPEGVCFLVREPEIELESTEWRGSVSLQS